MLELTDLDKKMLNLLQGKLQLVSRPFKLIGGIAKGHPNQAELTGAVEFFEGIMR